MNDKRQFLTAVIIGALVAIAFSVDSSFQFFLFNFSDKQDNGGRRSHSHSQSDVTFHFLISQEEKEHRNQLRPEQQRPRKETVTNNNKDDDDDDDDDVAKRTQQGTSPSTTTSIHHQQQKQKHSVVRRNCGGQDLWSCEDFPGRCGFVFHCFAKEEPRSSENWKPGTLGEDVWQTIMAAMSLRHTLYVKSSSPSHTAAAAAPYPIVLATNHNLTRIIEVVQNVLCSGRLDSLLVAAAGELNNHSNHHHQQQQQHQQQQHSSSSWWRLSAVEKEELLFHHWPQSMFVLDNSFSSFSSSPSSTMINNSSSSIKNTKKGSSSSSPVPKFCLFWPFTHVIEAANIHSYLLKAEALNLTFTPAARKEYQEEQERVGGATRSLYDEEKKNKKKKKQAKERRNNYGETKEESSVIGNNGSSVSTTSSLSSIRRYTTPAEDDHHEEDSSAERRAKNEPPQPDELRVFEFSYATTTTTSPGTSKKNRMVIRPVRFPGFHRTIYLDADLVVRKPIHHLFEVLKYYDVAAVGEYHSMLSPFFYHNLLWPARPHVPYVPMARHEVQLNSTNDTDDPKKKKKKKKKNTPKFTFDFTFEQQYNTGLLVFRSQSVCTLALINEWVHIHTHSQRCVNDTVAWDQCSLPWVLRVSKATVATLPEEFNFREALGSGCSSVVYQHPHNQNSFNNNNNDNNNYSLGETVLKGKERNNYYSLKAAEGLGKASSSSGETTTFPRVDTGVAVVHDQIKLLMLAALKKRLFKTKEVMNKFVSCFSPACEAP